MQTQSQTNFNSFVSKAFNMGGMGLWEELLLAAKFSVRKNRLNEKHPTTKKKGKQMEK